MTDVPPIRISRDDLTSELRAAGHCSCPTGKRDPVCPQHGTIPQAAIDAVTRWLHDDECSDGDTGTCGRWRAGSDPSSRFHQAHVRHVEFYRERAHAALEAAAPHIAAAERARIRQLALAEAAADPVAASLEDFADLLTDTEGGQADGT